MYNDINYSENSRLAAQMMKPMFALLNRIILVESRGVPELGIENVRNLLMNTVASTCHSGQAWTPVA